MPKNSQIFTSSSTTKRIVYFVWAVLLVEIGFGQKNQLPAVESFENKAVLSRYENSASSTLNQSTAHHRFGQSALEWDWEGADNHFGTAHFRLLSKTESPLAYGDHFPASPTFIISIYNENRQNEQATFTFEKNGKEQMWFSIPLTFTGWRHLWVPFYDMEGQPPKKGDSVDFDYLKISSTAKKGNLFFDDIIFSQYQDDRHQYPDEIVPFIKSGKDLGKDHWMPLISNHNRIKDLKTTPISVAVKLDLKKFENLIDQDLTIDKKYKVYIKSLRESFAKLKLKDNGKTILGPPLTFKQSQEYFNEKQQGPKVFNDIKDLGKVLKKLANFNNRANPQEQEEIEKMFLTGTKYFLDQGWQAGSNGGTRHHIGYNVRELTEAFFTMRKLLHENGLLNKVGSSLHWSFNLGMLLDNPSNFHVNIDYLNTQSYYHLMLIFLFEKQEKQAALLKAYSNYISVTLAQQKEEWGFKVDGTVWHHNGHYPAYGLGAFQTVPKVIRILSGTRFRIAEKGHNNFKNAFMMSRIYSQLYDWGFGNAGRHPLEDGSIAPLKNEFLLMAYAGNPEGNSEIDRDAASAYLRLWGKEDQLNTATFTQLNGIPVEKLSGYYTLPYAATAIHRRGHWAALIKGYSKYVWASEIYVNENRYGRYPANGTIELLNKKGEKGSGFRQEGWDWNRYPGATVIYLPFEELEPDIPLLMFRSNESFAGATELDGNGVFGMILNESKGDNAEWATTKAGFPGELKAKKSVFSYGDKLICIGTNISSVDEKNLTQTNLFQSFLTDTKTPLYTSAETVKKIPVEIELRPEKKLGSWLTDPYGNGYHILSETPVQIKKSNQLSYHNKYSIKTGSMNPKGKGAKETQGDYATAWINHGLAPKKADYQYIIYPFLNEEHQKNFGRKIKNDRSYTIQRADSIAHIVLDKTTNTTGYVIFENNHNLNNGILLETSAPALVMIRRSGKDKLKISAVQPDLNFPLKDDGKFKNYSEPVELKLKLAGKWQVSQKDFVKAVDHSEKNTTVTIQCVNGLPRIFEMKKV